MRSWDRFRIAEAVLARPCRRQSGDASSRQSRPRRNRALPRSTWRHMLNRLTLEAEAWAESGTRKTNEVEVRREPSPRHLHRIEPCHAHLGALPSLPAPNRTQPPSSPRPRRLIHVFLRRALHSGSASESAVQRESSLAHPLPVLARRICPALGQREQRRRIQRDGQWPVERSRSGKRRELTGVRPAQRIGTTSYQYLAFRHVPIVQHVAQQHHVRRLYLSRRHGIDKHIARPRIAIAPSRHTPPPSPPPRAKPPVGPIRSPSTAGLPAAARML